MHPKLFFLDYMFVAPKTLIAPPNRKALQPFDKLIKNIDNIKQNDYAITHGQSLKENHPNDHCRTFERALCTLWYKRS